MQALKFRLTHSFDSAVSLTCSGTSVWAVEVVMAVGDGHHGVVTVVMVWSRWSWCGHGGSGGNKRPVVVMYEAAATEPGYGTMGTRPPMAGFSIWLALSIRQGGGIGTHMRGIKDCKAIVAPIFGLSLHCFLEFWKYFGMYTTWIFLAA
jgi:hypothetical protein